MKKKKNYTFSECILTAGAAIMVLSMAALSAKQMTSAQIQAAACSSSLQTIGQAIASYAADYKDDLPHSVNYSYPWAKRYPDSRNIGVLAQEWLVNLEYVPLKTMRDGCPAYPAKQPKYMKICGYAYNAYLGRYKKDGKPGDGPSCWYKNFPAQKLSRIQDPDIKFIMADTVNYLWLAYIAKDGKNDWRHESKTNFLHFDGSVEGLSEKDFSFTPGKECSFSQEEVAARLYPQGGSL